MSVEMHIETNGWIKLHRRIGQNTDLMNDNVAFIIFIKLLMLCDRNTGRFDCGRKQLSKIAGVPPTTAYDALRRLQKYEMVALESQKLYTEVLIINWTKYQNVDKNSDFDRQGDRQVAVRSTVSQPPLLESDAPSGEKSDTVISPSLNKNRETRNKTHKEFFVEDSELREAFDEYEKMRNKIKKPMTDRARKLVITRLQNLYPNNIPMQIKCLDQSIENSWQGVFPIKDAAPAAYKPESKPQTKQLTDEERARGQAKLAEIRQQLLDKKK